MVTARSTLGTFAAQLQAPHTGQSRSSIKVRLEQGDKTEHGWLEDPGSPVGGYTIGVLCDRVNPQERTEFDASVPFAIR